MDAPSISTDRAEPHRAGVGVRVGPGGRPRGDDHRGHQAQVQRLPRRERRVEGGRGESLLEHSVFELNLG